MEKEDIRYMKEALKLALKGKGYTHPNPTVGAIIVKDGKIIGKGYHKKAGLPHAEREAIKDAVSKGFDITGSTMYVTLEPCCHYGKTPPCTEAIIDRRIKRVVVAALDPNPLVSGKGVQTLRKAGIEVDVGILK
ncbi:bifunctional diaminohydroxyphosphoribosylaminopyrimidine deaminase/5-amino-6-(5-phosphoribosylamino)uracil reductase RibD, partial [Persephonella sp.]|uniref:bifunctional diaminohydroxyphosphoribosylaminopyrimidine deaminase/5-amino-6-(5-phosphoribosylamino)uracil reductase RibD n=1 Tax=Persephonella sp. TaxID=2060922 RepID=UPI002619586B